MNVVGVVVGVLHEVGDADFRASTRSKVYVEYFVIPYTSTFIRLPHLYQECHVHCIVITNVWGMGYSGEGGDEGGQGLDIILLYFALLGLQSLYLGD